MRDKLVSLIQDSVGGCARNWAEVIADYLLANGVIVPPCIEEMADNLKEFANDVAYQFGYYCHNKGRLCITHGGLSTLEWAFDILGWENPHPVPECECEFDGCHEYATCGTPTKDGYKRVCGKHFSELKKEA